jgi:hypothetical protein
MPSTAHGLPMWICAERKNHPRFGCGCGDGQRNNVMIRSIAGPPRSFAKRPKIGYLD